MLLNEIQKQEAELAELRPMKARIEAQEAELARLRTVEARIEGQDAKLREQDRRLTEQAVALRELNALIRVDAVRAVRDGPSERIEPIS